MKTWLEPYALTLHVMEERGEDETLHAFCVGEIEVTLDTEDSAWIEPCSRLVITEMHVDQLADFLRPYGVKWMRGWHDGRWQGRVVLHHGTRGVAGVELFSHADDGGDLAPPGGDGADEQ